MELSKIILLSALAFCFFQKAEGEVISGQILYQMRQGAPQKAIQLYQTLLEEQGKHDLQLLKEMGICLIEEGFTEDDAEAQAFALFGASLSLDESLQSHLARKLSSPHPQIQIYAMRFLSVMQTDETGILFKTLLNSPNPLIRLETLYVMAEKGMPGVSHQAESLMQKLPPDAAILFPPLFVAIKDRTSQVLLRQFLRHPVEGVRVVTVLNLAKAKRDEFLPQIRRLATHTQPTVQEAALFFMTEVKDTQGLDIVKKMSTSPHPEVRVRALKTLWSQGDFDALEKLRQEALQGNLFAIIMLGDSKESGPLLYQLSRAKDPDIAINAAYALLQQRDPKALPILAASLSEQNNLQQLTPYFSPGHTMMAFKWSPYIKDDTQKEISKKVKEELLLSTADLPQQDLLPFTKQLFLSRQHELIPTLAKLLETLNTQESTDLLKTHADQLGAPFVRYYCTLALYRLGEKGSYSETIKAWVKDHSKAPLIRFRPLVPRSFGDFADEPTPDEESMMLIESLEALIQQKDDDAISLLLSTIAYGHPKNAYALAGLLIRACQ